MPPTPAATSSGEKPDDPEDFTLQELGQMMMRLSSNLQSQGKTLVETRCDQDTAARQQASIARQQEAMNKQLATLIGAVQKLADAKEHMDEGVKIVQKEPPDTGVVATRGWRPPPSLTTDNVAEVPPNIPQIRPEAPYFSGTDPIGWIRRVQKYFNHYLTTEPKRLLLDKAGTEPVNEFLLSSKLVSMVALLMELGISPVSLLKYKTSISRLGSEAPMSGGRVPEKRFC